MVCVERATRLAQFIVGLEKQYEATIRLGYATDTQDRTGRAITPLRPVCDMTGESLLAVLSAFVGPRMQTPPMFSAKKVGGQRLYHAARAGREVERKPSSITIHSLELMSDGPQWLRLNKDGTADFQVRVRCSSGTYVRTLANDIGQTLGWGAHLAELRRTAIGHFKLSDGLTLDAVERMSPDELEKALISPSEMLSHLRNVTLDAERRRRVSTGRGFSLSDDEAALIEHDERSLRLCDRDGRLVAVGEYDRAQRLVRPQIVLEAD